MIRYLVLLALVLALGCATEFARMTADGCVVGRNRMVNKGQTVVGCVLPPVSGIAFSQASAPEDPGAPLPSRIRGRLDVEPLDPTGGGAAPLVIIQGWESESTGTDTVAGTPSGQGSGGTIGGNASGAERTTNAGSAVIPLAGHAVLFMASRDDDIGIETGKTIRWGIVAAATSYMSTLLTDAWNALTAKDEVLGLGEQAVQETAIEAGAAADPPVILAPDGLSPVPPPAPTP